MRFPRLATRTVLGGLTFAGASLVFSTMALHLSAAPFRLDDVQIGLVGLVGVAGALTANFVGIGVDRGADVLMGGASLVSLLLAWGVFAWIGRTSLVAFIMGMVLLDLGLQGIHVANQGIIQRLDDAARSRITSIYMTGYFLGAAAGSAAGALVWGLGQWAAVCLAGVAFLTLAAGAWVVDLRAAADRARPTSHHSLEAQ
jgi:predicted MFS family arabinose efflux permease